MIQTGPSMGKRGTPLGTKTREEVLSKNWVQQWLRDDGDEWKITHGLGNGLQGGETVVLGDFPTLVKVMEMGKPRRKEIIEHRYRPRKHYFHL